MIHTGDITHLSKPGQFDDAEKVIGEVKLDVHYVPGELDEGTARPISIALARTPRAALVLFRRRRCAFHWPRQLANLKAGGMGSLGNEQLAWLADDLKSKSSSTPVVVFAHIPLWTISADWGRGTEDATRPRLAHAVWLGYRAQWPYPSIDAESGRPCHVSYRHVDSLPAAGPGNRAGARTLLMPAEKLRGLLGITSVEVRHGKGALAITDTPLATSR